MPKIMEVEACGEARVHDYDWPLDCTTEVAPSQHGTLLASEHQAFRAVSGVLLHVRPQVVDKELR
jgi:hypothetical protein